MPSEEEDALGPYWAILRRSQGEKQPATPEERIAASHPGGLVIATAERVLVRIQPDGTLLYGEGYSPDEAAVELWTAIARRRLDFDRRMQHITLMELHLALVAVADEAYEAAQRAARAPGAGAAEEFREEMSRRNWESRVHGLVEFAREYVTLRPDLVEMARRAQRGGH